MTRIYPFLLSIPHAGTKVPEELEDSVILDDTALRYYSDPGSLSIFDFKDRVAAYHDFRFSRIFVDLNRPPYHLPPRYPDGVVKMRTIDGRRVYREGVFPEMALIQRLMMRYYFPFHEELDRSIDTRDVQLAIDCHSMLPKGLPGQNDAGKIRPDICLGNHGGREGYPQPGRLATCPADWIQALAVSFREIFHDDITVSINDPYAGGFISLSHYWHRGVPWIQLEINRSLFEKADSGPVQGTIVNKERIRELHKNVWNALTGWWETLPDSRG
jgi:N-formylglutamate deformylase